MLAFGLVSVIAGCQTTTNSNLAEPFANTRQPLPETPQFKDGKSTAGAAAAQPVEAAKPEPVKPSSLDVVSVVVVAPATKKGSYSANQLDNARVAEIANRVIKADLEQYDNDKGWPVVVTYTLDGLYLAGGAGAFIGASDSAAKGTLSVTAKGSGAVVIPPRKINASGSTRLGMGGIIGLAMVGSQEEELTRVATALSRKT